MYVIYDYDSTIANIKENACCCCSPYFLLLLNVVQLFLHVLMLLPVNWESCVFNTSNLTPPDYVNFVKVLFYSTDIRAYFYYRVFG
jgi:hypothetical protein